jgi:DNA polymerase elongation subunit (family B)
VKLYDRYRPEFYIEPKGIQARELRRLLEENEHLARVSVERRVASIEYMREIDVLRLQVDRLEHFRDVKTEIAAHRLVGEIYDDDMEHELKYLADRDLIPLGKIAAEADDARNLRMVMPLPGGLVLEPPPLRVLRFGMKRDDETIMTFDPNLEVEHVFGGERRRMLRDFLDHFADVDPDLVACRKEDITAVLGLGRDHRLRHFGGVRCGVPELREGRAHVRLSTYGRLGLAGLVERVMYTRLPARLSSEWGAGRAIESRQCYEARRMGVLVPRRGGFQPVMTLRELLLRDHGGLIFAPDVGLHENVGALDFESMFPSLISRRNISYENVGRGPGAEGFLVGFTKETLDRRLHFKHLRKELSRDSPEYQWCQGRQLALKEILFCTYGYSGCWANRFGNYDTFMEINKVARDTLVESMNVARESGFRTIYGNNDSLFLRRAGATRGDYEGLAMEIAGRVGLPMAVENHFRFLVLLPQKGGSGLGAVNRYYGITFDGKLVCRGIELRRRDTALFVKRVQREAMEALLSCASVEEVRMRGVKRAQAVIEGACLRLRDGGVPEEELRISTALQRDLRDYKAKAPHVVAAEALEIAGKRMEGGSLVDYVYVDAGHGNPFRRVRPVGYGGGVDLEKYIRLVREAGRSVLMPFEAPVTGGGGGLRSMKLSAWVPRRTGGSRAG